jgi:hypothetical protein
LFPATEGGQPFQSEKKRKEKKRNGKSKNNRKNGKLVSKTETKPTKYYFSYLFLISFGKAPPGKLAGALIMIGLENGFRGQEKYLLDHMDSEISTG